MVGKTVMRFCNVQRDSPDLSVGVLEDVLYGIFEDYEEGTPSVAPVEDITVNNYDNRLCMV